MFKNLKIGVRLGLGFGFVLLLLAIISTVGIWRMASMSAATAAITEERMPMVQMAEEMKVNTLLMARAIRNVVISTDKSFERAQIDSIADARKRNGELMDKIKAMLNTDKGKELIDKVTAARSKYGNAVDAILPLANSASPTYSAEKATQYLFGDYTAAANDYLEQVSGFAKFQQDLADQSGKEAAATASSARAIVLALSLVAFVLAILFAWWVTRSITGPINESVKAANSLAEGDLTVKIDVDSKDETGLLKQAMKTMVEKLAHIIGEVRGAADALSSASEQVASTAQSLSQASSEQAASVEETSASIEQMTASITHQHRERQGDRQHGDASRRSEATEGGQAVNQTVAAMKQIAGKIGIIDDIAYQTNLLALNAAIEAARAVDLPHAGPRACAVPPGTWR